MKFCLNREKTAMLFIQGVYNFTYDSPGPIDINLQTLTDTQLQEIKMNVAGELLIAEDPNGLLNAGASIQPVVIPNVEVPVKKRQSELKLLLNQTIPTVKKSLAKVDIAEIKELKSLEKEGKNRKSLIKAMDEFLVAHTDNVKLSVGDTDVTKAPVSKKDIILGGSGLFGVRLDIIGDVVESEEEDVSLPIPTQ